MPKAAAAAPSTPVAGENKPLAPHLRAQVGTFRLPNGDRYEGAFLANLNTKSVVRHGLGTYETWDGHRYVGTWENDALAKGVEVRIEFGGKGNGSGGGRSDDGHIVYTGTVSNKMEYLEGTYQFGDASQIRCSFGKDNVPTPTPELVFCDARGARWDCAMDNQWLIVRQPSRQYVPAAAAAAASNGGGGDDNITK